MACEASLNQQSSFAQFLSCWCAKNADMSREERRKRTYYWSWHAENWFDTLMYLSPEPTPANILLASRPWWTWDPTPQSPQDAGVTQSEWEDWLDPSGSSWLKYAELCTQVDDASSQSRILTQALAAITGTPVSDRIVTQQEMVETEIQCPFCRETFHHPAVMVALQRDFTEFARAASLPLSRELSFGPDPLSATVYRYQLARGAEVNADPATVQQCIEQQDEDAYAQHVQIDAAAPLTAHFIRTIAASANVDARHAEADVLSFLRHPYSSESKGLLVRGLPCGHLYHEREAMTFASSYRGRADTPIVYAPLAGREQSYAPFQCVTCRRVVDQLQDPESQQIRSLREPVYELKEISRQDAEWGPYRLRRGALVWYYPAGSAPGSPYSGQLGILRDFVPVGDQCDYGGCFIIDALLPQQQPSVQVPVGTVFDLSFFEQDRLPTREQVSHAFSRNLSLYITPPFVRTPYFATENVGLADITHPESIMFSDEERKTYQRKLDSIRTVVADASFRRRFAELWARHLTATESPLATTMRTTGVMGADALLDKMLLAMGYYASDHRPSLTVRPRIAVNTFVQALQAWGSSEQNPQAMQLRVSPEALVVWTNYAANGYDIAPEWSNIILPLAIQSFGNRVRKQLQPLRADQSKYVLNGPQAAEKADKAEQASAPKKRRVSKKPAAAPAPASYLADNVTYLMQTIEPIVGSRAADQYIRAFSAMDVYITATLGGGLTLSNTNLRTVAPQVRNAIVDRLAATLIEFD